VFKNRRANHRHFFAPKVKVLDEIVAPETASISGNNYVDDGEVKRYRDYDSLPGVEIDELAASDFVKSVLEWNLPPWRFREVGTPGLFLSHVRSALFAGHVVADPGESFERGVTTAGLQLDLAFTLGHRLPMTLSLGYAVSRENGGRLGDEVMLSLKIL
jgi:hypothetical protein